MSADKTGLESCSLAARVFVRAGELTQACFRFLWAASGFWRASGALTVSGAPRVRLVCLARRGAALCGRRSVESAALLAGRPMIGGDSLNHAPLADSSFAFFSPLGRLTSLIIHLSAWRPLDCRQANKQTHSLFAWRAQLGAAAINCAATDRARSGPAAAPHELAPSRGNKRHWPGLA